MSIEAQCPVCDGQSYIDETAPPSHNCDIIGKKCIRCSGSGSVEVEITCSVCDNGVVGDDDVGGIGFCSEKCYKADIRRRVDKALEPITDRLEILSGSWRELQREYAVKGQYYLEPGAAAKSNIYRLHAHDLEKILAELKGEDHASKVA